MSSLVTAGSDAIAWNDVEATPYGSDYKPTMALAQNHIHFVGVPGATSGDLDIFVIHCKPIFTIPNSNGTAHHCDSLVLPARCPGLPVLLRLDRPPLPTRQNLLLLPILRRPTRIRLHPGRRLGNLRRKRRVQHHADARRPHLQRPQRVLLRRSHRARTGRLDGGRIVLGVQPERHECECGGGVEQCCEYC